MQQDDLSEDNSQFVSDPSTVDSSASIDTINKEITITGGAGGYTQSVQSHRSITNGRNVIMNIISKSVTNYPQLIMRANQADTVGAQICYRNNSTTLAIQVITGTSGGTTTLVDNIPLDGTFADELAISARSFNNLFEIVAMSGGYVVGLCRYVSDDFDAITGIVNGLGAYSTCKYKGPLIAQQLHNYINIIAFGDSNTHGYGDIGSKESYPNQLQAKFFNWNTSVVNEGISGDTVADLVTRYTASVSDNIVRGARNVVVLCIGTNDLIAGTSAQDIYDDICDDLITPMSAISDLEIWLCTVPYITSKLTTCRELNTLIKANTSADKIIDVYSVNVDSADVLISNSLQSDGIHLTEKSQRAVATLISNELYA